MKFLLAISIIFFSFQLKAQLLFSGTNEDLDSVIVNLVDVPMLLAEGSNTIVYRGPNTKTTLAQTLATVVAATNDNFFTVTSSAKQKTYRSGQSVAINKLQIESIIRLSGGTAFIKMKNPNVSLQVSQTYAVVIALATDRFYNNNAYAPTLDSITNVTDEGANSFSYTRSGNYVDVYGTVEATPINDSLLVQVDIPLPIASNFTGRTDVTGMGVDDLAGSSQPWFIDADTTDDQAQLSLYWASDTTARVVKIRFRYIIK